MGELIQIYVQYVAAFDVKAVIFLLLVILSDTVDIYVSGLSESRKIEERGGYVFHQTSVPASFEFGS